MGNAQVRTVWRRSGRCADSGCVEMAALGDGCALRDSTEPGGAVLRFPAPAWAAFLRAVRSGRFDG